MEARHVAEGVAHTSYGRLVALLAARTRDIAAAEDALAEAFRAALETWPTRGVPERPEAWLLTAARRVLGHERRHAGIVGAAEDTLRIMHDEVATRPDEPFPDERLKLLFVCAHPAIDPAMHTPLMLQTVLGLDAARIGAAFLVPPATMAQRLVRAKARIRDAGIAFELPDPGLLAPRLGAVMDAIYAAFGTAWDVMPGATEQRGLAGEAIHLARVLAMALPDEPEAAGLLALLLYCEARAGARRSADGTFVPLDRQDTSLWRRPLIVEAEQRLTAAARQVRPGRYQTEAAIQSVHCQRAITGRTNQPALVTLYDVLNQFAPTIGVAVARAVAHGALSGPATGLHLLDELAPAAIAAYQPYWVARAHLLRAAGRDDPATWDRAIGLTEDAAVRAYLLRLRAG